MGSSKKPDKLGINVAKMLMKEGVTKLAEGWRDAVDRVEQENEKKW